MRTENGNCWFQLQDSDSELQPLTGETETELSSSPERQTLLSSLVSIDRLHLIKRKDAFKLSSVVANDTQLHSLWFVSSSTPPGDCLLSTGEQQVLMTADEGIYKKKKRPQRHTLNVDTKIIRI